MSNHPSIESTPSSEDTPQSQTRESENGVIVSRTRRFVGPLPPPEILAHYNEIVPGSAERILVMAEKQSQHRQTLEAKVITSDITKSKMGLWFAFILGLVSLGGGVFLIYIGRTIAGSIFSGVYLVGVMSVFIYGSQQRRKERQVRSESNT
jgi:uncharacterized membrane protein